MAIVDISKDIIELEDFLENKERKTKQDYRVAYEKAIKISKKVRPYIRDTTKSWINQGLSEFDKAIIYGETLYPSKRALYELLNVFKYIRPSFGTNATPTKR